MGRRGKKIHTWDPRPGKSRAKLEAEGAQFLAAGHPQRRNNCGPMDQRGRGNRDLSSIRRREIEMAS